MDQWPAKRTQLGALEIRRALPLREKRMVGPWCFLDRYGPLTFRAGKPMDVAPHPHTGLQTVSWLLDGEVLHRDSLGFESMIVPGELNLMTSGRGISHSEETPGHASGVLNGVQLWVALPDVVRLTDPAFNHYQGLPVTETRGGSIR
ncbi:MAG TPA: pirin family protein, partial [Thermoanaerobaculia bacterium]|nr:pirin family protein [Thermoanaerobaculia bacterium]